MSHRGSFADRAPEEPADLETAQAHDPNAAFQPFSVTYGAVRRSIASTRTPHRGRPVRVVHLPDVVVSPEPPSELGSADNPHIVDPDNFAETAPRGPGPNYYRYAPIHRALEAAEERTEE